MSKIVINKNKRNWKDFIISIDKEDTTYKAIIHFWSKSYKITLLEPDFKIIDKSSIGNIANHRFDFKNDNDKYIIDIKEIANKKINQYISNII